MGRLMGVALLLGGGLWLGLGAAGELRQRVCALDAWIASLASMENELAFRLPDLPDLLNTLAHRVEHPAREVFEAVCARLEELGLVPFDGLWQEALSVHPGGLSRGDVEVLSRLGNVLGRYGWEDQRRVIGLARKELETRRGEAQRELKQKGRARVALGLTVGGFLTILLI